MYKKLTLNLDKEVIGRAKEYALTHKLSHHNITTSQHHNITTSQHHHITPSSHHFIITLPHHPIITLPHYPITSSSHYHITTSSHHHIITSSHHLIITLIFPPPFSQITKSINASVAKERPYTTNRFCS